MQNSKEILSKLLFVVAGVVKNSINKRLFKFWKPLDL